MYVLSIGLGLELQLELGSGLGLELDYRTLGLLNPRINEPSHCRPVTLTRRGDLRVAGKLPYVSS